MNETGLDGQKQPFFKKILRSFRAKEVTRETKPFIKLEKAWSLDDRPNIRIICVRASPDERDKARGEFLSFIIFDQSQVEHLHHGLLGWFDISVSGDETIGHMARSFDYRYLNLEPARGPEFPSEFQQVLVEKNNRSVLIGTRQCAIEVEYPYRQQGYANLLTAIAFNELRERGVQNVSLLGDRTPNYSEKGQSLFSKFGAIQIPNQQRGDKFDRIIELQTGLNMEYISEQLKQVRVT